ncbi:MAG: cytochrome P450 [Propionibacteriaceae bacterium]|nr:cytochrome P450 [Propionibacteriaceae bacterium]
MADASNRRRACPHGEPDRPRVESADGVWRIRALSTARQVLQARTSTTQAGFTAEHIPRGVMGRRPVLFADGPDHDAQRKKVGRFFAPKVVADRYTAIMRSSADRLLKQVGSGGLNVDELALHYAVEVTREVVGLTESSVEGMSRRLERFFNQPPFDITKPDLGRTNLQWAQAAVNGMLPVMRFWWSDVRPAIRQRRRRPRSDVISHLIAEGYRDRDILVECITYGTAGMVTTREFISMAVWHLLHDDGLRESYLASDQAGRLAVLSEIIRLEPVVGHLYRRVQEEIVVSDGEAQWRIPPGDLVDLCIRHTNTDPAAVGELPLGLCPGRQLPRGVDAAGLSFGHGSHKCPGQPLALLETDVLLNALLARRPRILSEPRIGWDDLVAGYTLRGFTVELTEPGKAG